MKEDEEDEWGWGAWEWRGRWGWPWRRRNYRSAQLKFPTQGTSVGQFSCSLQAFSSFVVIAVVINSVVICILLILLVTVVNEEDEDDNSDDHDDKEEKRSAQLKCPTHDADPAGIDTPTRPPTPSPEVKWLILAQFDRPNLCKNQW